MFDLSDKKYFKEEGDPGFSPARNKWVVENTIKKTEALIKSKRNEWDDKMGERSEAVASYLTSKAVDNNTPIEKYLGKRNLAYLRGQRILQRMVNGVTQLGELPEGQYIN